MAELLREVQRKLQALPRDVSKIDFGRARAKTAPKKKRAKNVKKPVKGARARAKKRAGEKPTGTPAFVKQPIQRRGRAPRAVGGGRRGAWDTHKPVNTPSALDVKAIVEKALGDKKTSDQKERDLVKATEDRVKADEERRRDQARAFDKARQTVGAELQSQKDAAAKVADELAESLKSPATKQVEATVKEAAAINASAKTKPTQKQQAKSAELKRNQLETNLGKQLVGNFAPGRELMEEDEAKDDTGTANTTIGVQTANEQAAAMQKSQTMLPSKPANPAIERIPSEPTFLNTREPRSGTEEDSKELRLDEVVEGAYENELPDEEVNALSALMAGAHVEVPRKKQQLKERQAKSVQTSKEKTVGKNVPTEIRNLRPDTKYRAAERKAVKAATGSNSNTMQEDPPDPPPQNTTQYYPMLGPIQAVGQAVGNLLTPQPQQIQQQEGKDKFI